MDPFESVRRAMADLLAAASSTAESVWTRLDGGRLHHLEAGSGPPVLLLHGGTGGGANWFRLIGRLSGRHRVLAPDLPGFGLSDPVAPAAPLGSVAADIILDWMTAQRVEDAIVVGTSFGGLTAVRLLQAAPIGRIRGVLLIDSAGFGRRIHPAVRLAAWPPLTPRAVKPTRRGTRHLLHWLLTSGPASLPSPMRDALVEFLFTTGLRAGTWYLVRTLRLFVDTRGQREVFTPEELATIRAPVDILWGSRDRMIPSAHAERAARHIPGAMLQLLPGIGHSPNWEVPDAVATAIDALGRRSGRLA